MAILSLEWSSEGDRLASGLTQLPGQWLVEKTCKCWFCPGCPLFSAVSSGRWGSCGCKPGKPAPDWSWWVCSGEIIMKENGVSPLRDWPAMLAERIEIIITYFTEFPAPFSLFLLPLEQASLALTFRHSTPSRHLDLSTSIQLVWYRGFLSHPPTLRPGNPTMYVEFFLAFHSVSTLSYPSEATGTIEIPQY